MVQYKAIEDSARKTSIFLRFYSFKYNISIQKLYNNLKKCIFMLYLI